MTRRRLRILAMAALALAIALFITTVQALRWIALLLVLASIPVLLWTLWRGEGRDA